MVPNSVRNVVRGTVFEPAARRLWQLIRPVSELEKSEERQTSQIREILKRTLRTDWNCVDVGAHKGDFLTDILRFAPEGRHHAFEPIPELADALRQTFPHVTVHNVALSSHDGESTFHHVVSNPAFSGLKERTYARPDEQIELLRVTTRRLDDVLDPDEHVHFIKIDVEGAELQVLQGAERTLRRCQPCVVFEHGVGGSDHYGTTPARLHEFLQERCGYQVNKLDRFLTGQPALNRCDFAAVTEQELVWNFVAYAA